MSEHTIIGLYIVRHFSHTGLDRHNSPVSASTIVTVSRVLEKVPRPSGTVVPCCGVSMSWIVSAASEATPSAVRVSSTLPGESGVNCMVVGLSM